jgi:HPt (histidine-containing phosphotransfer) domain-containing protein
VSDPAATIAARLAQLWQSSRPTILERLSILRAAHAALLANPEDTAARSEGREAAHKLSGVLGVFGMPQGSEIAHIVEECLKPETPLSAGDLASMAQQITALDAVIAAKGEG